MGSKQKKGGRFQQMKVSIGTYGVAGSRRDTPALRVNHQTTLPALPSSHQAMNFS
jgi:hypothetical protein